MEDEGRSGEVGRGGERWGEVGRGGERWQRWGRLGSRRSKKKRGYRNNNHRQETKTLTLIYTYILVLSNEPFNGTVQHYHPPHAHTHTVPPGCTGVV